MNNAYRDALTKAGLHISGTSPDGRLVEFVELDRELHPFFVATQAHPELKSRPTRPHPLFAGVRRRGAGVLAADRLPVESRTRRRRRSAEPQRTPSRRRGRTPPAGVGAGERRGVATAGTVRGASAQERFRGPVFTRGHRRGGHAGRRVAARDYVRHVGAVGVVALDDDGRVVLVRQYRHPVGRHLWELPAGLCDVRRRGRCRAAALRELAEEADLRAGRLGPAGGRAHLARLLQRADPDLPGPGPAAVPAAERHARARRGGRAGGRRVDLDEAVAMVLRGEITNAACVAGLLAAARARDELGAAASGRR